MDDTRLSPSATLLVMSSPLNPVRGFPPFYLSTIIAVIAQIYKILEELKKAHY